MNAQLTLGRNVSILAKLGAKLLFLQKIQELQNNDLELLAKRELVENTQTTKFSISDDGSLYFHNLLCISKDSKVLLQLVMIPEWKCEQITIDFVSELPLTPKKKDPIWVIIDRLMKLAHFIPIRTDYPLEKLVELYVVEIVRLHGAPLSIISDHDPRTPLYWFELSENKLAMIDLIYEIDLQLDLSYSEEQVKVLAWEVKEL
ncbi:integrase [Gossypium australe]|uniref:Integrase n=1 Tax=Gossypium australe TaxID=47621 RepID=A0A5B6VWZ7_9ROSI|nr:integrase [Gossypium australe]